MLRNGLLRVHTLHVRKPNVRSVQSGLLRCLHKLNVTPVQSATEWTASVHTFQCYGMDCFGVYFICNSCQTATEWNALVDTLHMSKLQCNLFKVLRKGLLQYILYTPQPDNSCSKCCGMDCFRTLHMPKPNVIRVQSATEMDCVGTYFTHAQTWTLTSRMGSGANSTCRKHHSSEVNQTQTEPKNPRAYACVSCLLFAVYCSLLVVRCLFVRCLLWFLFLIFLFVDFCFVCLFVVFLLFALSCFWWFVSRFLFGVCDLWSHLALADYARRTWLPSLASRSRAENGSGCMCYVNSVELSDAGESEVEDGNFIWCLHASPDMGREIEILSVASPSLTSVERKM